MSMPFCGLDISALLDETQTTRTEDVAAVLAVTASMGRRSFVKRNRSRQLVPICSSWP